MKRDSDIKNDQDLWKQVFNRGKISNFEDFYLEFIRDSNNISHFIYELCKKRLSEIQSQKLIKNIDNHKVIRTAIRANLYMNFTARNNKTSPALDKTDDFRHLIDASLCTYFITDERKLKKYASIIHPELKVITFNELINPL